MPDRLPGVWIYLKLCLGQRSCYCSVVCVIPSLLQDLTTVCKFFFDFSFERYWRHFTVQRHLLRAWFNSLFIPLNWNLLKFKRVICLWKSAALLPIISLYKLELWHNSLSLRRNDVKKDVHKDLYWMVVLKSV